MQQCIIVEKDKEKEQEKISFPKEKEQTDLDKYLPREADYWSKYNKAKCSEKRMFYLFLDELCNIIPEPPHQTGRKPIPLRDLLFCACLKIYNNHSARRISSDLKHAQEMNFISHAPHFNSLVSFLNNPFTEELLKRLITISAMPLKQIETDFAFDSTGFSTYQHDKWIKTRWSNKDNKGYKDWVKCHAVCGTISNIITKAEVTVGTASDTKQLPNLIKGTSANFNALRYSGDKAYLSHKNFQLIQSLEAMPFIPFKRNSTTGERKSGIWNFMFNFFQNRREEFDKFYHRRSNIESCFSMMKYVISPYIKSKNLQSRKNEVLIKCLCHNLCCLIEQFFFFKIKIDFRSCDKDYVVT